VAINREKVLEAAQKFVEKKKYDKAVAEYQKIIQEDPNDARILLKVGDLQLKMLAYADAIGTYEKVGKFYAQQGFALKAIAVYKQIREIIAKHAPGLEDRYSHITPKLAELYQQLGLTSDALAALDDHATRLQRQQRDQEAIEVFGKIVELDPTNPLPHLRLAEALSRIKDADNAVSEFGIAASLLVKLGRRDDAIKVFERLLHHKPDPTNARLCAELYLERAQPTDGMQALAKLQICFQANQRDLDTLALLARAFGAIGQAGKGIEVQKEMARIAKEQGKTELFKQVIEKLQRLAPNDEGVRALAQTGANMSAPPPKSVEPVIRESAHPGASVEELSYDNVVDSGDIEEAPDESAEAFPLKSDVPPPVREAPRSVREAPRYQDAPRARPPESGREDSYGAAPDVVIDAEEADVVSQEAEGLREAVAQVLADAASFRRVRLYAKAVETLRGGLELDPQSREMRESLRDILLETRQYGLAAQEMLVLASLQVDTGDVDGAGRTLYDVLSIEPNNGRAQEMLTGLGYELPGGAPPEGTPQPSERTDQNAAQESYGQYADDEAPLPAYELEDTGGGGGRQAPAGARARGRAAGIGDIDEPFDGPLPSFPLAPESEASFDLVQGRPGQADASAGFAAQAPDPMRESRSHEIEDALDEVDFYASRGLYDDARAILTEQLSLHPKHPLLRERLAELDSQEQGARGGSGTREVPRNQQVDRSFDIAASLDAIENLDTASGLPPEFNEAGEQVDVEEVFAKFKEGVAKQVSVDDAQSHYDLGVAYKEMGLIDDAIREFDVAARDTKRECVCRSMIGMIQVERGRMNEAIEAFLLGLRAPMKTPEQETVLCYEIGAAYEGTKRIKEALSFFQKVARRDPSYRDVGDRIARLSGSKVASRAAAVGADEDFDRAFDEIIGGGKLP
jgi:tetratricopeptide (TPR) repeat protein